jgi:hypothetical protein
MFSRQSSASTPRVVGLALLLAVVLISAVPIATRTATVSAQSATGSGQFCPQGQASGLPCQPGTTTTIASNFIYCSDGSVTSVDQGCPVGTGAIVPASSFVYCSDGSVVSVDQSCARVPGTVVPASNLVYCSNGSLVGQNQTC